LTRGLSALFWGLPLTLIISVQALTLSWLGAFGSFSHLGPPIGFGILLYGLALLGGFRRDEPSWTGPLDRARLLALTALGLSPFLHWYQRLPGTEPFSTAVGLLTMFSLAFLFALNQVLLRLSRLLPDELIQAEAVLLTRVASLCLLLLPTAVVVWTLLRTWSDPPIFLRIIMVWVDPFHMLAVLFLTLLPLSITMSLLWKLKEAALQTALDLKGDCGLR